MLCRVCGRELDDCGTCVCASTLFGQFLRYAVDTCVNPGLPSLEVLPPGAAVCSRCGAEVRLEGFCAECEEGRDGSRP